MPRHLGLCEARVEHGQRELNTYQAKLLVAVRPEHQCILLGSASEAGPEIQPLQHW